MKEMRYINPLTDFGFKKIFGDEEIMRDFLNDIIEPNNDAMKTEANAEPNAEKTNVDDHNIRHIALSDVKTREVFSNKLQMWLVELPRYRSMSEADCKSNRDYWLYTLTHMETMIHSIPFQAQKPIFHKLENMADLAALTTDERNHYNISLDSFRTNLAVMDHERNVGRAEGRAEGFAEGHAEGFAEGHVEGREYERKNTSCAIARNLLSSGLDIAFVAKSTGLTEDEVKALQFS